MLTKNVENHVEQGTNILNMDEIRSSFLHLNNFFFEFHDQNNPQSVERETKGTFGIMKLY